MFIDRDWVCLILTVDGWNGGFRFFLHMLRLGRDIVIFVDFGDRGCNGLFELISG